MSDDALRRIADAVLYEGYVLWPYRRSALKNQRRWAFGGVYPRAWSERAPDDPWIMQTECLVEGEEPAVDVRVRFLQVVSRKVLDGEGREVAELEAGGLRHVSWDEAIERELGGGEIDIAAGTELEPLPDGAGRIAREWEPLHGRVEVALEPLREELSKLRIRIENTTSWEGDDRQEVLRRTFCSTHTILRAGRGKLVSLTDPPEALRAEAEACENRGTWPVLVGEEGQRHTVLSSPIILSDYPQVAPESPGDMFDGGEIDELLILNVLALTDDEREEMRASDPRTRELLERVQGLPDEHLLRLHGAIRDLR